MPVLNFHAQWADAVEIGALAANGKIQEAFDLSRHSLAIKRTTIRRPGRAKVGDTLYLFTGQRTKQCRRLGEVLCLAITPIYIPVHAPQLIRMGPVWTNSAQTEYLARLDTAELWVTFELFEFIKASYGLPFHSELIAW